MNIETKKLLQRSETAFETAREILFLVKKNSEEERRIEKMFFEEEVGVEKIKELGKKWKKKEQILKIASQIFLKEFNLEDKFMSRIEDFILDEFKN